MYDEFDSFQKMRKDIQIVKSTPKTRLNVVGHLKCSMETVSIKRNG